MFFCNAFKKQKSFEKTAFSQSKKKSPLYDECSPAKASDAAPMVVIEFVK
jgi:hypothetical protein